MRNFWSAFFAAALLLLTASPSKAAETPGEIKISAWRLNTPSNLDRISEITNLFTTRRWGIYSVGRFKADETIYPHGNISSITVRRTSFIKDPIGNYARNIFKADPIFETTLLFSKDNPDTQNVSIDGGASTPAAFQVTREEVLTARNKPRERITLEQLDTAQTPICIHPQRPGCRWRVPSTMDKHQATFVEIVQPDGSRLMVLISVVRR